MGRICVVTSSEFISGNVENANRIGNLVNEPFRTYGYVPDEFMKISQGRNFQSFLMTGLIISYDRYSGYVRCSKHKSLIIPFGFVEFIYGVGEDKYKTNLLKKTQNRHGKALEEHISRFRLKLTLGGFELEGDCELGPFHYLFNKNTGKKEITSFKKDFMTLENVKILSAMNILKYSDVTHSISRKYFVVSGARFDVYEDKYQPGHHTNTKQARIKDSYFGLNPVTPIIISTQERLIGPYSYRELQDDGE